MTSSLSLVSGFSGSPARVVVLPRDGQALWSGQDFEEDHTVTRMVDDPDAPEREVEIRAISDLRLIPFSLA